MAEALTKVGLQLLLEPTKSSHIFSGACVAAGVVHPAYQTYKAVKAGTAQGDARMRWLKYWAVWGAFHVMDRSLGALLDKMPFYPHAKLVFVVWLQMHQCQAAASLYDEHLSKALSKYERKLDVCLEAGHGLAASLYHRYGPAVALVLGSVKSFVTWFVTEDSSVTGPTRDATACNSATVSVQHAKLK